MTSPCEVTIDGVRYVPVYEGITHARFIAQGLLELWWGKMDAHDLERALKNNSLRVEITEDGTGHAMQDVLAKIAEVIARE